VHEERRPTVASIASAAGERRTVIEAPLSRASIAALKRSGAADQVLTAEAE
jgi:hypothetical protein